MQAKNCTECLRGVVGSGQHTPNWAAQSESPEAIIKICVSDTAARFTMSEDASRRYYIFQDESMFVYNSSGFISRRRSM